MNKKAKFAIGSGIIIVTLSCLAYVGAQQSKTYYHTISEIPTLSGADGRFVAETLQAKCASKYEAAPGQAQPAAPAAYSSDPKSKS